MELIVQAVFFIISFIFLFNKDRFLSIFYFVLYVYMLPDEISCRYYPFLLPRTVVGNDVYVPFFIFCTTSLIALWLFLYRFADRKMVVQCVGKGTMVMWRKVVVYGILLYVFAYQGINIILAGDSINYFALTDLSYVASNPALHRAASISSLSRPLVLLLLVKFLNTKGAERNFSAILFAWGVIQNMYYSYQAGSRSSMLGLLMGIVFMFLADRKLNFKTIMLVGLLLFGGYQLTASAFQLRSGRSQIDRSNRYSILTQDYAGPEVNTIAVVKYHYVDPWELLKSQFLKTFPYVKYPYLYVTVGELFAPGVVNKTEGYGFYVLTEGYICAGQFGFFYNAIFIGGLLLYWRRLGRTNDSMFNRFILSFMMMSVFAVVRTQSNFMIRNTYMQIFPATIMYAWLMGVKIDLKRLFLRLR